MPQKTSPYVESKFGWNYGESGWNTGMDENLIKFGFLLDATVDGIVDTLPAPSSNGLAYYLTTDKRFYFSADGTWYSSPVPKYFEFKLKSDGTTYVFNGTAPVEVNTSAEVSQELQALEDNLGTAAYQDVEAFATNDAVDAVQNNLDQSFVNLLNNTSDSLGAALVGYKGRTLTQKLAEVNSIVDFGAVGDGSTDSTTALISALSLGSVLVPNGDFIVNPTASQVAQILSSLYKIRCDGSLTINLPAATINLTEQVVINSPTAQNIAVVGATTPQSTITGQVSVTGSARAYSVTLSIADASGWAVNDYALIRKDVTGTGDFYSHAGIWKITAVSGNNITLLNTNHSNSFPVNTITGGTIVCLKTVLKFTGCDAFRFEGGQPLKTLDRVAIVGDYNLTTNSGTVGAHGIVVGAPVITNNASSNAAFNPNGEVIIGQFVGVSAFGEQGIAVSMRGSMVANFVASCSNRKRGIYSEGGHIRCKLSICSGNGEDGFISDTVGMIQCALSIASGNGLNGFWSTNNSLVNASGSIASGNLTNGFECRGLTRLNAENAISLNNGARGYTASYGGMIYAPSCTAIGNISDGLYAVGGGSTIQAQSAILTNNGAYGARAQNLSNIYLLSASVSGNTSGSYISQLDSLVVDDTGAVIPGTSTRKSDVTIVDSSTYRGMKVTVSSSLGDASFALDNAGSGTFTSRLMLKADGTVYPTTHNSNTNGRDANRWSAAYSTRLYLGSTGTAFDTSGAGSPEGSVSAPVGSTYRRTDGGATTTFYVKESGTGSTGWVAK